MAEWFTQFLSQKYWDGWKKEYLQTIKYITFKSKGKQLVLKSPPNTERICLLLQMFPQAKFIYIYRNPYHMYYSIKNMWKRAILAITAYRKFLMRSLRKLFSAILIISPKGMKQTRSSFLKEI